MATAETLREYHIDQIQEHGFTSVEIALGQADIDELFLAFAGVLDEAFGEKTQHGQDIVDAFAVMTPGRPHDSAGFLTQRRIGQINPYEIKRDPATDDKDLLHYTPISSLQVPEYLRTRGGMSGDVRKLVSLGDEMHERIKTAARPVFSLLGVEDIMISPVNQENVHLIRLINYLGTESESVLTASGEQAELHLDRSTFTGAFCESDPGLVGAPGNNAFGDQNLTVEQFDAYGERALATAIDHYVGRMKLFTGGGYNHLPADIQEASGNLDPLLHGVINKNPGNERKAGVVFMNHHVGLHQLPTPASETGFSAIREQVEERQRLRGGMLEDAF